ncbi:MAG: tetratricopeptide repeat protein [Vicinamibacterales bacterium]
MSPALASGILASALALAPGLTAAQSRAAVGMAEANALFAAQRYAEAATAYEAVLIADPSLSEAHFFLANALDNQYRPANPGLAQNDHFLEAAHQHYLSAAALLTRPDQAVLLKRTLQFLAALYGRDKLNRPGDAEPVVRQLMALDPGDMSSYFGLVKLYEDAGRTADAEAVLQQARMAAPDRSEVWTQSAQFFNRQDRFDEAMEALEQVGRLEPSNPQASYQLAVYYEEKVRKDFRLPRAQQTVYVAKGLEAVDRALSLRPDYFEALTYKNLILRQQARFEADPGAQRALIDEADRLQRQALDVRNAQTRGRPVP